MYNRLKSTWKFPCTFPMYLNAPHGERYMQISMHLSHVPSCTTRGKAHGAHPYTYVYNTIKSAFHVHSCVALICKFTFTFLHYTCTGALWKFPVYSCATQLQVHRNFHGHSDDTESVHGNFYTVLWWYCSTAIINVPCYVNASDGQLTLKLVRRGKYFQYISNLSIYLLIRKTLP